MSPTLQQQEEQPQISIEGTYRTGGLLRISPEQFQFTDSRVTPGQVSKVKLKNTASTPVGYKFKTNAPMKYSVKPVLGVLAPGESIKIFVRSDSWISPQDKFLLQSVALTEEEGRVLDPRSWKDLNSKRFIESYIPCSCSSALSLRDPEDDAGSLSSSSATSSSTASSAATAYTPPFHAHDLHRSSTALGSSYYTQQSRYSAGAGGATHPSRQQHQQVFERWQYAESTRPTISIGGLGRRLSSGSTTTCSSATSSPGSYPTLFTTSRQSFDQLPSPILGTPTTPTLSTAISTAHSSKRNSVSSNFHGTSSIITSTIKEESISNNSSNNNSFNTGVTSSPSLGPSTHYLLSVLGFPDEQVRRTLSKYKIFKQCSMRQVLLLSLVCLLFGMLMPFDRVLGMLGGNQSELHQDSIRSEEGESCPTHVVYKDDVAPSVYVDLIAAKPGAVDLKEPFHTGSVLEASAISELEDGRVRNVRHGKVEGAV